MTLESFYSPFLLISYSFPTRFLLVSTRFYSFLLVSYSFLLVALFTNYNLEEILTMETEFRRWKNERSAPLQNGGIILEEDA